MDMIDQWTTSLLSPFTSLWNSFAAFLPQLLAAALIMLVGYLVARLVRTLLRRVLGALALDKVGNSLGLSDYLQRAGMDSKLSALVANLVFWILLLVFVISALDSIGLPRLSATLDAVLLYLPKAFGALLILLAGLFIAGLVRDLVRGAAAGIGIDYANALGTAAYGLLLIIVVTLAIGQLDLETQVLNQVISILVLSLGAATALAFGLGARDVAGNILAGTYVRELYEQGDRIRYRELEGEILYVGAIKTLIRNEQGEASIPNSAMASELVSKVS